MHGVQRKGCLSYRRPSDGERHIFVGDGKSVEVEAIGHFRLLLGTGFYLDLIDTFVVPSFRRNLVSVSLLDKSGYNCSFRNNQFTLSINSDVVGTGSLNVYDPTLRSILRRELQHFLRMLSLGGEIKLEI